MERHNRDRYARCYKNCIEEEYLAHLLCLGGTCKFVFNANEFELHPGDLSIVRRRSMIEKIRPANDFSCKIIYAKPGFIELSTPQSNYATKGQLSLSTIRSFISRLNSRSSASVISTSWSNASRTPSIVFTAKRLSMPCRLPSSISSISTHVSMARTTSPRRMHLS